MTAGGPADLLVRGLGQKLNEAWGQQVVVENKPGANEIIAAQDVAKSPSDGYSYLLASDAVFSLNAYLYSKLPYDPAKDFVPVSKLVNANLMLVARPDFPAGTPRDIVARFAAESARIVNTAEFKERYLNNLGFEPVGDTPEQFAAFLRQDREMAAKKVKASGAKLD